MLTPEQFEEIKKFNRNVGWLMKNPQSVPVETSEWIKVNEAMKLLERGRTWIQTRMLKPEEATGNINVNWFLIRGADWDREGNQLIFKRESILRLKSEMRRLGQQYEQRISSILS